jgi:hypothetical protein
MFHSIWLSGRGLRPKALEAMVQNPLATIFTCSKIITIAFLLNTVNSNESQ